MRDNDTSSDRLWFWFAVVSVVFLAVLAVSPVKDYFRPYRHYQQDYRQRLLAAAGTSQELKQARSLETGVRQVWLRDFEDRVDRCTTCHLGVDQAQMADAPQPFRLHPVTPHTPDAFDRFGCVSCHRGQGRATSESEAHGEVADWSSPLLPLGYTEASCGTCHEGTTVPEAEQLSAGRALLLRAGCYGCHLLGGGEGWESSAPDLDGLADKTSPDWLRAWLHDPRALRATTWMPTFRLDDPEIEALVAYLWVQPPQRPLEGLVPEELPAGDSRRGKKLFREARCISCHTIDGRGNGSAPELDGVGSADSRRWLVAFLGDPHAFQPQTKMPQFAFSREDLLDLSQYFVDELSAVDGPQGGAPFHPPKTLIDQGAELYQRYGCGGCHRLGGKHGSKIGPDLTGIGSKPAHLLDFGQRDDLPRQLPDWLAAKVTDPRSFRDGLKMPVFGFDEVQTTQVVTALLSYTGETIPESYRIAAAASHYAPPGRFGKLVQRYRCLSCHRIQGAGGDISTAPLTAEGSKVRQGWLSRYLLVPTTIRPVLTDRMIVLGMAPEEANFLADFMKNVYVDDSIPGDVFPDGVPAETAARGKRLFFERYGCQSCHQVQGTGGYYGPPLDDTPKKLVSGWVAWWLQGPQRWRSDIRCPDFGMDATDATDLAGYLVSLPQPPAAAATGGTP